MKVFTSQKQKIGRIGEQFAEMFLVKQGFTIIDRNFSTRFGEIDIITKKSNRYYFFEVKTITVTRETRNVSFDLIEIPVSREIIQFLSKDSVSRETLSGETIKNVTRETFIHENRKLLNPFQNISFFKVNRLLKTAEIYLKSHNVSRETRWQIDGIGVYLDLATSTARFQRLENITIR